MPAAHGPMTAAHQSFATSPSVRVASIVAVWLQCGCIVVAVWLHCG